MTLRVVGAGLGRTGTHSQKLALEQLLGGPCYHMIETFGRPDDIPVWHRAIDGDLPDWAFPRRLPRRGRLAGLRVLARADRHVPRCAGAAVDARCRFVVDERERHHLPGVVGEWAPRRSRGGQQSMAIDMLFKRFTPHWQDEDEAKAAFVAHNEAVRAAIPKNGSSSGSRATAGNRSATRWACRFPTSRIRT